MRLTAPAAFGRPMHWAVLMNWRNRSKAFALLVLIIGWQQWPQQPGPAFWAVLVGSFLLYPQLVWWWANHHAHPLAAEVNNLRLDCVLLGAWSGYLGFPPWITFTIFTACVINLMLFRGILSSMVSMVLFAAAASIVWLLSGTEHQPDNGWEVMLLCQTGLLLYLMSVGFEAFRRSTKLSLARQALRDNSQALEQKPAEIQALQNLLREQVNRDGLTGLYNRRYMDTTLEREMARCARDRSPLSVLLLDIDHVKGINDEYGHPVGDAVLQQLGRTLGAEARASDVVCRYGGEEFLLVLPGMTLSNAIGRAERLRELCERLPIDTGKGELKITISVGVACFPDHATSVSSLLQHTDQALYQAKENGRNRVEVYQPAIPDSARPTENSALF